MRLQTLLIVFLLGALLVAFPENLWAQSPASGESSSTWAVAPYVGISRHSPVGTHWGLTPARHHLFVGVHATNQLADRGPWSLSFAPEAALVIVSNNPIYHSGISDDGHSPVVVEDGRGPVAGVGVSPIGLEGRALIGTHLRLYAATAGGGIWFTRQVPVYGARAFNFTCEFGGGVEWQVASRMWLRAGYKFHHLSNAKTADRNPGLDAQVFLFGLDRSFGSRR